MPDDDSGDRCGDDEADQCDGQVIAVDHQQNLPDGGPEHPADGYFLAAELGLEIHQPEDTDEGN